MKNEIKQKAARVRWGNRAGKSKQIRVDECAARALLTVPETDRRRVATHGVMAAVDEYKKTGVEMPCKRRAKKMQNPH